MDRSELIRELNRIADVGIVNAHHDTEVLREALELLKEPEPHLMTVDELEALPVGSVVWEECYYNTEEGEGTEIEPAMKINSCTIMTGAAYTTIVDDMGDPDVDGNILRWWSSKPTDEQRKAVKWDG